MLRRSNFFKGVPARGAAILVLLLGAGCPAENDKSPDNGDQPPQVIEKEVYIDRVRDVEVEVPRLRMMWRVVRKTCDLVVENPVGDDQFRFNLDSRFVGTIGYPEAPGSLCNMTVPVFYQYALRDQSVQFGRFRKGELNPSADCVVDPAWTALQDRNFKELFLHKFTLIRLAPREIELTAVTAQCPVELKYRLVADAEPGVILADDPHAHGPAPVDPALVGAPPPPPPPPPPGPPPPVVVRVNGPILRPAGGGVAQANPAPAAEDPLMNQLEAVLAARRVGLHQGDAEGDGADDWDD